VPGQNRIFSCLLHSVDTTSSVVVLKADTKVCRLAGWTPANTASPSGSATSIVYFFSKPYSEVCSVHILINCPNCTHNYHHIDLSITKLCQKSRVLASNANHDPGGTRQSKILSHIRITSHIRVSPEFCQREHEHDPLHHLTLRAIGEAACFNPIPETVSRQTFLRSS
jgi:hypothetical protein